MNNTDVFRFRLMGVARISAMLVGLFWFGVPAARAAVDTHYVVEPGTPGGTNTPPYTNWGIAATQIQWAVNESTVNDAVLVSNGVYVLTNTISINKVITLKSANGPEVTVINGNFDPAAPIVTTNNRCIQMTNATVMGFTISNGVSMGNGGGVQMTLATLSNCWVRNCKVIYPAGGGGMGSPNGGGVWAQQSAILACKVFDNMVTNINNNTGIYGAGIFAQYAGTIINGCTVNNNTCYSGGTTYGAGVSMASNVKIYTSLIVSNTCSTNGGAAVFFNEVCTIGSCTVSYNQASSAKDMTGIINGGGTVTNCVAAYNAGPGINMSAVNGASHAIVSNTIIVGNAGYGVYSAADAGAAWNTILANCIISGNSNSGIYFNPGIGYTNCYIYNCTVSANSNGGVSFRNGVIRNCLIADNSSTNNKWAGLVITRYCSTTLVSSCTIAHNIASDGEGSGLRMENTQYAPEAIRISSCIIYSNGVNGADDVTNAATAANLDKLQYSCVGSNRGFTGVGLIVANPRFNSVPGRNYRMGGNSPCVNSGSNETWMTNAVDLDGKIRIRYGTVDMGAYETLYRGMTFTAH